MTDKSFEFPSVVQIDAEIRRTQAKRRRARWRRAILILLLLALIAGVLISMKYVSFLKISGNSMEPMLRSGDVAIYQMNGTAARGSIVAIERDGELLVKRVIGIAGDKIRVAANGVVYVNGAALEETYGIIQWMPEGFAESQKDYATARFETNGLQMTLSAKDEKAGRLQLKKSDSTDHMKSLSGAVLALFSDEACTVSQTYYNSPILTMEHATTVGITVDIDGTMIYGLREGTYYLKELAAPEGYCLISGAMKIVVDASGNISSDVSTDRLETTNTEGSHTATVYDVPIRQLPATGGRGTSCLYAVGLILMLFAAYLNKGKCAATRAGRR